MTIFNLIAGIASIVGLALSIISLLTAKGAKAQSAKNETRINALESTIAQNSQIARGHTLVDNRGHIGEMRTSNIRLSGDIHAARNPPELPGAQP